MSPRATASFDIDSWEQQPYDEREGATIARVTLTKTFRGDLEGSSTAELLMVGSQEPESKAYVGLERIVGRLHGRSGSFVLHHTAIASPTLQSVAWTVVPDTGTGELKGISGQAQISNQEGGAHVFTLDYELIGTAAAPA